MLKQNHKASAGESMTPVIPHRAAHSDFCSFRRSGIDRQPVIVMWPRSIFRARRKTITQTVFSGFSLEIA
jgi:hypothetical protein